MDEAAKDEGNNAVTKKVLEMSPNTQSSACGGSLLMRDFVYIRSSSCLSSQYVNSALNPHQLISSNYAVSGDMLSRES